MSEDATGGLSRRSFITRAGAAGAGTIAIAGCTEKAPTGGENANDGSSSETSGDGSLSGKVAVAGSSTVYPLAEAVVGKFEKKHPKVKISVQSTGSGAGFSNFFCTGKTDFNNASRPIQESEKRLCEKNGVEWHEIKVATDAITVVVNNDNDWVDCVTPDQLQQIFGQDAAKKWSDVNPDWPDENIERYGPSTASGTFDYFSETINGEEGAHTGDYQPTEKDNLIVNGVSGSKYAIGYLGFAYYSQSKDKVKALGIDDGDGCVEPTLETAKSGKYAPLSRPLFTYPSKSSLQQKHVAEFARFFVEQSADEKLVAENVGYVPNSESEMQTQLDQLNQFIETA